MLNFLICENFRKAPEAIPYNCCCHKKVNPVYCFKAVLVKWSENQRNLFVYIRFQFVNLLGIV